MKTILLVSAALWLIFVIGDDLVHRRLGWGAFVLLGKVALALPLYAVAWIIELFRLA